DAADRFMKAVGPERELQNGIMLERVEGTPQLGRSGFSGKPQGDRKPYKSKRAEGEPASRAHYEKPDRAKKDGAADDNRPAKKPWAKKGPKPAGSKPGGGKTFKPKRKE